MKKHILGLISLGLLASTSSYAQTTIITGNPTSGYGGFGGANGLTSIQVKPAPAPDLSAPVSPSQKPITDDNVTKDKDGKVVANGSDTDIPATYASFTKLHQKITPTDSNPYGKPPKWELKWTPRIDYDAYKN